MNIFEALSEPTRRDIIEMLAKDGKLSASDISGRFSSSAPAISQHLKVLREANLVRMEKNAQQRIYTVNFDTLSELGDWAFKLKQLYDHRFKVMDELLEEEKRKAKIMKKIKK